MSIAWPLEPHTISVRTRLGLRQGGRQDRYLRLFAWKGEHGGVAGQPADPIDSAYGLYCECPHHRQVWKGPRNRWAAIDPGVPALAGGLVLPWAETLLAASAEVASHAVMTSEGEWDRMSAICEANILVDATGARIGWIASFALEETPDPGRLFLRIGIRPDSDRTWITTRAESRTSEWRASESPSWQRLRQSLVSAYGTPLTGLLGSIERSA